MSNNSQIAFSPLGQTVVIPAAASASTGLQVPVYERFNPQSVGQFRIVNGGTNTVFLGVGTTAAEATAAAVAPTAGTPTGAVPLVPGAVEILRFPPNAYFSGVASGATTVYITPGQGL